MHTKKLLQHLFRKIGSFLDRPDVRKAIGVDPSLVANFTSCNSDVNSRFHLSLDQMFPTELYIGALLERGVRVLIYVGENDWICNWVRSIICPSVTCFISTCIRSETSE